VAAVVSGAFSNHLMPRQRTPALYRICERVTEAVLCLMVVFTPWAFGTTQEWAIWTMNVAGYALGALLVTKWFVRWRTGYEPSRWGGGQGRWLVRALAALTVLVLAWCLTSAINRRAIFLPDELRLEYRDNYIPWLPHSYDAPSTWFAFWTYSGLAWSFWAARDWLLGKTRRERHVEAKAEVEAEGSGALGDDLRVAPPARAAGQTPRIPARLRRLLWVLCVNGALLATEGILQRLDGTTKLLWLVEPRINNTPQLQFGPYAYRANGAQYLDLVWPVCLGFWWTLRRETKPGRHAGARVGGSPHLLLLLCTVLMAVAPFVAASRGGLMVASGCLVGALVFLLIAGRREGLRAQWPLLTVFACVAGLGGFLGWNYVEERLAPPSQAHPTNLSGPVTDLTMRWVMQVPETKPEEESLLAALSDGISRTDWGPNSLAAYLEPDGSLKVYFCERGWDVFSGKGLRGFWADYAGQVAELAVVKSGDLLIYINGRQMLAETYITKQPTSWTNAVATSYFHTGRPGYTARRPSGAILAAAFFDRALSQSEVESMARAGAGSVGKVGQRGGHLADVSQWKPIVELDLSRIRLPSLLTEGMFSRQEIYSDSRQMVRDHGLLGSGPGTFGPLYYLYRNDPQRYWSATAHDDWLETRITFGAIGFALVLLALALVLLRWWFPGGMATHWILPSLCWLAMAGCLAHAKFDFPFQVYSTLFVFLLLGCVLFCVSRKGETGGSAWSG
jgi:hypothetical protein